MEEEYIIIVRWAQEDVETLYNLLNYIYIYIICAHLSTATIDVTKVD